MSTSIPKILHGINWLHFKLYRIVGEDRKWNTQLNWYHEVLRRIIKPIVESMPDIKTIFFGIYGPEDYSIEDGEEYDRQITPPKNTKI